MLPMPVSHTYHLAHTRHCEGGCHRDQQFQTIHQPRWHVGSRNLVYRPTRQYKILSSSILLSFYSPIFFLQSISVDIFTFIGFLAKANLERANVIFHQLPQVLLLWLQQSDLEKAIVGNCKEGTELCTGDGKSGVAAAFHKLKRHVRANRYFGHKMEHNTSKVTSNCEVLAQGTVVPALLTAVDVLNNTHPKKKTGP